MECFGMPDKFPVKELGITLDYNPVTIAHQEHILPRHMELRFRDGKKSTRNEVEYANYRHYGAQTTIRFAETAALPNKN
jgi:hypothetical protein